MPGRGTPRAGIALAALLAALPASGWAAGVAAPASDWAGGFCAALEGIIAAERARVEADFGPSLADVVAQVRSERRMEGAPGLTAAEATNAARRLWALWLPVAPAASVGIDGERDGAWLFLPTPAPDPPYTGAPIRIDRDTGEVTWALPDPSEREWLHAQVCRPAPPDGAGLSAAGE